MVLFKIKTIFFNQTIRFLAKFQTNFGQTWSYLLIEFDISMLHQEMDVFGPQLSLIKVDEIRSKLVFFKPNLVKVFGLSDLPFGHDLIPFLFLYPIAANVFYYSQF